MSQGHTPGPWKVGRWCWNRPGLQPEVPSIDAGPATVAQLHVAPITPLEEAEANALLIAAAPDLLEAARDTVARHDEYLPERKVDLVDTLRAAIAKAEGPATEEKP